MIRQCLFPVAGLGTRFLPATKSVPKEMMPLLDQPAIQYGVQEALASGCQEMVLITGRNKSSIEDYFDRSPELEALLAKGGKEELLQQIQAIAASVQVASIRQKEPLGLGHAVLCGEALCTGDFFAVILPDDVMEGTPPVLAQLIQVHQRLGGSCVALEQVSGDQISRYGVVSGREIEAGLWRIDGLVEKPPAGQAPSSMAVMGRYVLSRRIFDLLRTTPKGAGGEIQLTDALRALAAEEPLYGVVYRGERYDCGTIEGWLEANLRKAIKSPRYHPILEKVLEGPIGPAQE